MAISVAVGLLLIAIGLNSIWLVMMYHTAHDWPSFLAFITPRVIKNLIMFPFKWVFRIFFK